MIIRPATTDDFVEFYGKMPPVTVRALAAVKDGVIKCIAGITYEKNISIAFSDMKAPDLSKKEIYKTAQRMAEWMKQFHPMIILTEEHIKSDKFIRKLGWIHLGEKQKANIYRL